MENNDLSNSENIFVKLDENNVIFLDPNSVVVDGVVQPRSVKHENLVMYVNLEADIVPRSRLLFSEKTNLQNISEGTFNMLRSQNGPDGNFTSDWTESYVSNNNNINIPDESGQSFGITAIKIDVKGANFIPQVQIDFVDVRGKSLFESTANSPYRAFFHIPWPIFYLTVKGFYGKAIKYRLHLVKINTTYNSGTGNFETSANFVGSTFAFMSDIPLQGMLNAPYMFMKSSIAEEKRNEQTGVIDVKVFKTSKGYVLLKSVYDQMKAKKYIPEDFPVLTLRELGHLAGRLDVILEKKIYDEVLNPRLLTALKDYGKIITKLKNEVNAWRIKNVSTTKYVEINGNNYFYLLNSQSEVLGKAFNGSLEKITHTFNQEQSVIIDVFNSFSDIKSQINEKLLVTKLKPTSSYRRTETKNEFEIIESVAIDKLISDIEEIEKIYVEQDNNLTELLEKKINTVVRDPNNGIGFDPTVRNVFAIVLANAEVYIKLMREVHEKAFAVGEERKDIIKNYQDESIGEAIYPWPEIKKSNSKNQQSVIAYPGENDLRNTLKSNDPILWPEVAFVEEFLAISTNIKDPLVSKEGGINDLNFTFVNDPQESKVNDVSSFFLVNNSSTYVDKTMSAVLYEIYERAKIITLLDSYPLNILNELANAEFLTIKQLLDGDVELLKILKDQITTLTGLKNELQNISPYERYNYYLDSIPTTESINNTIATPFYIQQYDEDLNLKKDLTLYKNFKNHLKNYKVENYRYNIYPFNSETYLKYINNKINNDLNGAITLDESQGFLTSGFDAYQWIKNPLTINDNFFTKKLRISENTETNILNTPYFHKQLFSDYNKESSYAKYAGSAYLLLNSFNYHDLNDNILITKEDGTVAEVRMSTLFKEIGSSHIIPHFLILKWGSIYHRYKKYILDGEDILNGFTTNDDDLTTTNINPNLFFNNNKNGDQFTGYTFNNSNVASLTDEIDVGIHPYYDAIFHEIISGYKHYDDNEGNNSFSGKTSNGSIIYDIKNYGDIKYWSGIVDNSKYGSENTYTILPSSGANKYSNSQLKIPKNLLNDIEVGINDESYSAQFQSNFRLIWNDEYIKSDFSGKTFFSPYEYNLTYDEVNEFNNIYSLNRNNRKIYDLIGTFSPEILSDFERIFIYFSSEKLNGDAIYKRFKKVKYEDFQSLLKDLVVIDKTDGDIVFDDIKNKQKQKLYQVSLDLMNSNNFLKVTMGNPKELNSYVFEGFYGKEFNTLTFSPYNSSQLENQKYIDLYIGENPDQTNNYYLEFFQVNNIELSQSNVITLRPLILIYAGYRKNNGLDDTGFFKNYIKEEIFTKQTDFRDKQIVGADNRLDYFLTTLITKFRDLSYNEEVDSTNFVVGYNNDQLKIETYNFFKSFNDKWSAGNSIGQRLLMDEFLFLDKANVDIGDRAYINIDKVLNVLSEKNIKSNLYGVISMLLSGTGFDMRALPAYVNYYESSNNSGKINYQSSKTIASTLFGTYLEVDYQDASPKIIIQYVGQSSKHLADLSYKERGYKNDGFHISDRNKNPLTITTPELFTDERLSKSNKVVAFQVNIGDQNQGIFTSISLDQATIKNTSESFIVTENIARSEAGAGAHNVDIGLFDIYRTASYSCEVSCLGNVMIQPTMFFDLNNIPMFRGAYWITEVSHNIRDNNIETKFKGSRIPISSFPDATDSFVSSYRPLLDKVINNAIQQVKTIPASVDTETSFTFNNKDYTINSGTTTIEGETFINTVGINNSIPYNGYNGEKYIQKVKYKGEEWLRAFVVRMDGDSYPLASNQYMSFISFIEKPPFKISPSKVEWFELRIVSDTQEFYSTKFLFEKNITADYILNKQTVFLNPVKDIRHQISHNYELDRTDSDSLTVSGPVNIGPPDYTKAGVGMSIALMRKLKLLENEVVYFKII